jgi:hypothetical protein
MGTQMGARINAGRRSRMWVAALIAVGGLVAWGFGSGWLAISATPRPVGRLRPADLLPPVSSEPSEVPVSETVLTTVLPTSTVPASRPKTDPGPDPGPVHGPDHDADD